MRLQDTEDLVTCADISTIYYHQHSDGLHTSDDLDLGNAMAVTEDNTDLGGGGTLLGELADVVNNLLGSGLEPRRRAAGEGNGRGRNALALAVKATVGY